MQGRIRSKLRLALAALYLTTGVAQLAQPWLFLPIAPRWISWAEQWVFLSGILALAGAAALYVPTMRRWAGIALALYALCIFPAHTRHLVEGLADSRMPSGGDAFLLRVLFQPVFVWWALFAGDVLDWPFRSRRSLASGNAVSD